MFADLMPTKTGANPKAWISFTLPETILVPRVKVFTNYVSLWPTKPINGKNKNIDMFKQHEISLWICYSTQKSDFGYVVGLGKNF